MKRIGFGLLGVAVLGLVGRATAEPISFFTEGPGNSWDFKWDDTRNGAPIFQWEDPPSQANCVNLPAVPDGGLTASMLGLGILGLCYVRRIAK